MSKLITLHEEKNRLTFTRCTTHKLPNRLFTSVFTRSKFFLFFQFAQHKVKNTAVIVKISTLHQFFRAEPSASDNDDGHDKVCLKKRKKA